MDKIIVITLNSDGEQVITSTTVDNLYEAWHHDTDIPANNDTVVSCVLGNTSIYFETFGDLMQCLSGEC